jgi:RNA polymerase sigma-70 factor (ECF subfamily)
LGSFKAWLLNMTRWRIIGQFRKRTPSSEPRPAPDSTTIGGDPLQNVADPAGQTLDAVWEAEWENNLLDAAIARMKRRVDPLKYQIFDLYVNKEWPPEKVAESFKITVDQVYVIKHRITETIKTEVKRLQKEIT